MINIITDQELNEVQAETYAHGAVQSSLASSGVYEKIKWSAQLHLVYDEGQSYRLPDTAGDGFVSTSDPRHGADVLLNAEYEGTSLEIRYAKRMTEEFYLLENISENNEYNTRNITVNLKQKYEVSDNLEGYFKFGVRKEREDAVLNYPGNTVLDLEGVYKEGNVSSFNNWQLRDDTSLQFGFDYRRVIFDTYDTAINATPINLISDFVEQDNFGAYLQLDHQFNEYLEIFSGLRFDSTSGVDSNLSPRLGLIFHINEDHDFKILYGEAFRAPAFEELYFENVISDGDSGLEAETVQTIDLVWLARFEKVNLHLGYFYSTITDSIVLVPEGSGLVNVNSESDESFSGLEFEAIAFLDDEWSLRSGGSYFFNQSSSSFRESEYLAFCAVNYKKKKYNLNVSANYMSSKERLDGNDVDTTSLDGFWDINAKISYDYSANLEFFIQGKNLLNQEFKTPSTTVIESGVPSRKIELSMGVKWKF